LPIKGEQVRRGFVTIQHGIVAKNPCDTQPVIGEDVISARALRRPMYVRLSPAPNCILIFKE
jgi:hypothetical protein